VHEIKHDGYRLIVRRDGKGQIPQPSGHLNGFHCTGVTLRGFPLSELTQPSEVSRQAWRSP
jgi:hypothetical protein